MIARGGWAILPIYLTTDKRRAEHYALARAAYDNDIEAVVIGFNLPEDKVAVDDYSSNEPGQFISKRAISMNTIHSSHCRVDRLPMPTGDTELIRLRAFAVGMSWGEDRRLTTYGRTIVRRQEEA